MGRARALSPALLWRKPKTRGNIQHTRSLPHRIFSLKLSIYSKWRRPFANNIILLLLPTTALLPRWCIYVSKSMHMTHPSRAHKNTKRGADEPARQWRARAEGARHAGGFYPWMGPRVARADCVRASDNVVHPLCRHLMQTICSSKYSFEPFKFIYHQQKLGAGTC